jgi:hypothetical protein
MSGLFKFVAKLLKREKTFCGADYILTKAVFRQIGSQLVIGSI